MLIWFPIYIMGVIIVSLGISGIYIWSDETSKRTKNHREYLKGE